MKMPLCLYLMAAFVSLSAWTLGEEPDDMVRLRESYENAVARSVGELSQTYLVELQKIRDRYTTAARLEEANAVQKEIDLIIDRLEASRNGKAFAGAQKPIIDTVAVIPANSMNGFNIGDLRRGDTVVLTYVSGLWKNDGNIPSENPDTVVNTRGDMSRLVIAESPDGDRPGKIITQVPPETSKKPYQYNVQTSRENLILRIHTGSDNPDAPGSVTYKLQVLR